MKKLSLLVVLTVLIGSALFVTSCGAKFQTDTVWQNKAATNMYFCFCADGKVIVATETALRLYQVPGFQGDYTATGGKIKAAFTGYMEWDYKISGSTMTISKAGVTAFELTKVSKPTVAEMKAAKSL